MVDRRHSLCVDVARASCSDAPAPGMFQNRRCVARQRGDFASRFNVRQLLPLKVLVLR